MEKELEIERKGINFDKVIKALMEADKRGEKVYFYWNGVKLHSEGMTEEKAYLDAYKTPKEEWDKMIAAIEEKERKESAAALAKVDGWIEEGKELIYPERSKEWEKCVNVRAHDLYHGADLEAALDIMKMLDANCTIEEAKEQFRKQDHSNNSAAVVDSIILHFSKRGPEFFKENTKYMDEEIQEILDKTIEENKQFEQNQMSK